MIISIVVFAFFKSDNLIFAILERIVLLPLVAGISYEIISFFGMLKGKLGRALAMPGMWFQCFTTREPDDLQIFIAIKLFHVLYILTKIIKKKLLILIRFSMLF